MKTLNEKIRFETDRLLIDEASDEDVGFFLQIESIPENKKYEMTDGFDPASTEEEFGTFLKRRSGLPSSGAILFVVKLKDHFPIGHISLACNWEKTSEWELGYAFLPTHVRQGFAHESVLSVLRFAFNDLKIHKMMAFVNAENLPSIRLLEKLNAKQEGHMREARLIKGKWADEKVFSMLASDMIGK